MEKKFRFSNTHTDFQARDAKVVFGWRYSPRIIFKAAKGTKLIDMDNNEYYDLTSGMMCMVLGHSHPELTEVIARDGRHFPASILLVLEPLGRRVRRAPRRDHAPAISRW